MTLFFLSVNVLSVVLVTKPQHTGYVIGSSAGYYFPLSLVFFTVSNNKLVSLAVALIVVVTYDCCYYRVVTVSREKKLHTLFVSS